MYRSSFYLASSLLSVCVGVVFSQSSAPGPKAPGVTRIGVMAPNFDMGPGTQTPDAAESMRSVEVQYLTSPKVDVVKLAARLPVAATAEAKALNCDYVLTSSLTQATKKAGGFGSLRALSSAATMMPGIGMASRAAGGMVVAAAAAQTAAASVQLAGGVKAKSEITFEYSLVALASSQKVLGEAQKAKAQTDGQDVVTPLIQNAANEMYTFFNK